MKIKKNFLKKLAAITLGFVMTLGVGAAGYAASASETRADSTVSWSGLTALPGSDTEIGGDSNVVIKTSSTNSYTNPARVYANTTVTITAKNSCTLKSVTYNASSTGNYVTYAKDATVSPSVTPSVSIKAITWTFTTNPTVFTFKPSSQTRFDSISVTYSGGTVVPVSSVALNKTSTTLSVGGTETLIATVSPANASDKTVTWSTSNSSVATVSNGTVTAVAAGNATITASAGEKSATCSVIVSSGGGDSGDSITVTQSSSGITATGYNSGAERTWTQNEVTFGAKAVMKESGQSRLQFQASNGVIYNTTAFSSPIASITLTQKDSKAWNLSCGSTSRLVNATGGNYNVTGGSTEGITNPSASATTMKWTIGSNQDYTFFALKVGGSAAYLASLAIELREPAASYNVTFNGNGSTGGSMASTTTSGSKYTTPSTCGFTKTNCSFKEWALNSSSGTRYTAGSQITDITGDIELFAIWNATISFNANGHGTAPSSQTVEVGDKVTAPTSPSEEGFSFGGWYTEQACTNAYDFNSTVSEGRTLYAKWTQLDISSISVKTAPTKVSYMVDEKFDPSGLVLNLTYSDQSKGTATYSQATASLFTFDPNLSTGLQTSNTSVSITYGGKTCSQGITVEEPKTLTGISVDTTTTPVFKIGGTFNKKAVTATYNHGNSATVTDSATFSGYDMNTSGTQTVNVSYTESGVTKGTSYSIKVVTISSFTYEGTVSGIKNEAWDSSNLVIKANWASDFGQETLTSSDYSLTFTPSTASKGTTSVNATVSYKNGLASGNIEGIPATVVSITTDDITLSTFGFTSESSYSTQSKTFSSTQTTYECNGKKSDQVNKVPQDDLQIRGKNNSGIYVTASSGNVRSISVVFGAATTSQVPADPSKPAPERHLQVFGKNTAYSSSDMPNNDCTNYDDIRTNSTSTDINPAGLGTYLGEIVWKYNETHPTSLAITGNYSYFALVSSKSAIALTKVSVGWGEPNTLQSITVNNPKQNFKAGDTFSLGNGTVTANYSETGDEEVDVNDLTFTLGGNAIEIGDTLTKSDSGKSVVVTYTDSKPTTKTGSYTITVDYADATSITLTNTTGTSSTNRMTIPVGGNSEQITAVVQPSDYVESGITIVANADAAGKATVNTDGLTIHGVAEGNASFTVKSKDGKAETTLYVYISAAPTVTLDTHNVSGFTGDQATVLEATISNATGTLTYDWTVVDITGTNVVSVSEVQGYSNKASVEMISSGSAKVVVEGFVDGVSIGTDECIFESTQSRISSFSVANGRSPLVLYTGDNLNSIDFTPSIETVGNATKEIKWHASNDRVKFSYYDTELKRQVIANAQQDVTTTGSQVVTVIYNPTGISETQSVTITISSVFDPNTKTTRTISIIPEEVTSFTWSGGEDIKCYENTALDASNWSFAATFASGDSSNPTLGSGANDVHVYIVDDASITDEPTTLTPVSNGQTLSVSDNGYLVAFYKGYKCTSTYALSVVDNLNSIIAERTIVDEGTKTTNAITSKVFDADNLTKTINDLTLTLDNNGGYYGSDSTKGQQVGSGNSPATSMTLSTSVSGTISKVIVNTSGGKDVAASVSVTVGSTNFTCNNQTSVSISATATSYEFTGSASGTVVISWSQTSSKALYFKQVDVTYNNTTITHPEVANTNIDVQSKVVEYARAFNTFETIDSATWSTLKANFNTMINSFSTEAEKSLAREMFKYATTDSTQLDVLQQCVKKYDKALAKLGLADSENFMDRTRIQIDCSISSYMGFKFTGLTMEKGQLTYEATYNGTAIECGFVAYKVVNGQTADFSKYALADLKNGELSGARVYSGDSTKTQLVMGIPTTNMDATLQVAFYFIDDQNEIHWSDSITMSFNDAAKAYDLDSIDDVYARLCLEYYLSNLENPVGE